MEKDKKKWLNRIGWAGFVFFLIKGLAWIGIWIAMYFGFAKGCT